jgi:periplasmic protein TonB
VTSRLTSILWVCLLFPTIFYAPCWGQSDAMSDWKRKIFNQLRSHAQFPPEACGRTGQAKVGVVLDRSGKVISSELLSGSGVASIDAAALAAVKTAQPFPPAPPDALDNDLKFIAPLVFLSTEDSCERLRDGVKLRSRLQGVCRGC